ncbi:hypothetical protein KY290_028674 [Solanum tuberosum]|uniref:F-box domain-containing protein n=1 Tax=Solanum tuberosum TaxID=4113 RepID=A0ABQ7UIL1_SOLTU|nr:hypothetical protein KY290_028674 [Solanum tuberosum]
MEETDQISKLPEPVLDHILSFLDIKDAAKTSTLSKVLITCNIKELFLDVGVYTHNKFPEAIFAAKSLNVLSLRGFKLELPSDHRVKFYSLRELHLEDSFLDEKLLQAIYAICSDLEVLSLKRFHGLISLQVAGTLPKLRTVKLKFCPPKFKKVDIVAPNLKDLYISSLNLDLRVIEITACKSLKCLKLTAVAVNDKWLESLLPNLPNLEVIYLDHCQSLNFVKMSNSRVKFLKVAACSHLIAVDMDDAPNLLRFSYDIRHGRDELLGYFEPSPIFKLKASRLLEVMIKLIPDPEALDTDWYSKLTESIGNFNKSRAITLSCDSDKVIVIPKDMRENLVPPLNGTKHIHIKIMDRTNYSIVDVVDSLLWISPQLDTLSVDQGRSLQSLIKFTYRDTAADEDDKPCCASLAWKCWSHELKRVQLQNFTRTELERLRNYFLKFSDTLSIIEDSPECSLLTSPQ